MRLTTRLILLGALTLSCGAFGLVAAIVWKRATYRPPVAPLQVRLDGRGPYMIVSTRAAAERFGEAIAEARKLHPDATEAALDPLDPAAARPALERARPRYALVFVAPEELDLRLAWGWLEVTSRLDADPFVDVRTGFVTGLTPTATAAFVRRIAAAARGALVLPGALVDNLGPMGSAAADGPPADAFHELPVAAMLPALAASLPARSLSHGPGRAFGDAHRDSMRGAGLVHLGGHGFPDGVVGGVSAAQAAVLELSPCVVWSGACYTGVTGRWYDPWSPSSPSTASTATTARSVAPGESFCLRLLGNDVVGYLAALHADHGIPVYQELELLASSGASLGELVKATHDGVVLGAGGRLPPLEIPRAGATPSEIMLVGSTTRILFGDPSLVVSVPRVRPPFEVAVAPEGEGALRITATLVNPELRCTLADTYHADLSAATPEAPFNARALFAAPLPEGWSALAQVDLVSVTAGGRALAGRLVGWAVEEDGALRWLYVQVDLPASGFLESPFRVEGAAVAITARR